MAERKSAKTANTPRTLRQENEELKARLAEAEDTLRALRIGEVDAIVVSGPAGPAVFTLRGAEHAYRVIVETMTEGAATISLGGTVLYGNPSLGRILETPVGAVMSRPLADFVAAGERRKFADFLKRARSGPARGRFLVGDCRPAYFSTTLLQQAEEGTRICLVVTDLTEHEAALDQLREAQAEKEILQKSEERFRLLAEGIPQIVWTASPDGTLDYYNKRGVKFSGIHLEEGPDWMWSGIVHPDDWEKAKAAWQRSVAEGLPYEVEHRLRRADGEYRWLLTRALPLIGEDGRIVKWYGTATDITETKRKQEELAQLAERLASSNRELERFAYVASHDLQEPLRSVTGFLGLLKRRYQGKLSPEADEFIEFAVAGASRMQELILDLLRYSRVESQGKPLTAVDSGKTLAQVVVNLQSAIEEAGAKVEAGTLPVIAGDDSQLVQLFQNLVGNAVKFRRDEPPLVRVSAERQEGGWRFAVADNGIGIKPEFRERILQVFQRLHTQQEYPGTGIGLAICKKIVERHGGRIWVESQPGQGTTVYFTLPDRPAAGGGSR
ncbi:MAG: ATP-binding protein [Desulfurivibrionaceae bacterium]